MTKEIDAVSFCRFCAIPCSGAQFPQTLNARLPVLFKGTVQMKNLLHLHSPLNNSRCLALKSMGKLHRRPQ